MGKVVSNDVSAIIPEIWSSAVQVPLYKSLVALEVANTRLEADLSYGDTVKYERYKNLAKCWKTLRALVTTYVKLLEIGQSAGQELI